MLSEKVLPLTRKLIPDRLSKSTTATGFLLSTYSATPSGVMTSSGSGSADVPRRKPRTRPLAFVKTRQLAGALPCRAWARTACGSSMPGSRISVPGDLMVAEHPHYHGPARTDLNGFPRRCQRAARPRQLSGLRHDRTFAAASESLEIGNVNELALSQAL